MDKHETDGQDDNNHMHNDYICCGYGDRLF